MIYKILILAVILGLIYFVFFKKPAVSKAKTLEECDICGTFVEKSELSLKNGKKICKECKNANNRG